MKTNAVCVAKLYEAVDLQQQATCLLYNNLKANFTNSFDKLSCTSSHNA